MEKSNQMGTNRTGIHMSPIDVKQMQQDAGNLAALQDTQVETGSEFDAVEIRMRYIREAERIGSVPPPGTVKGAMKTGMQKLSGKNPEVLIDKLGERLAFERSGTRLYEAMIVKCRAAAKEGQVNVSIDQLLHIHAEEAKHFKMLSDVLLQLGADPTAETPCANVAGVAASGIMKVVMEPRTTIAQCLDAVLTAELVDNAAWELLIQLANEMGQDEMVAKFREALSEEEEHLAIITQLLQDAVLADAT